MIRNENEFHTPVLLSQVIVGLNIKKGGLYIDATIGGGGHTREILQLEGKVLGIDQDPNAVEYVKDHIQNPNLLLQVGNFRDIKEIAQKFGFNKVDGILFDLGISSYQLDKGSKGFSFLKDEPLDMRMDKRSWPVTAEKVVNKYSVSELYDIFTLFAEEIDSRDVSKNIVRARKIKPIKTTADLVSAAGLDLAKIEDIGKAARIFQAVRIEVNQELENLKRAIPEATALLVRGGRLLFISFHSLEDRIIKKQMKNEKVIELTKKPIVPDEKEQRINPRSRSAKLRIYEKI
ncbi:16S rRNA (cytosine(1402)-N(4))-methyltransferase RsmH [Candidatus Gottesmanbacteria bacterium]|nr:16S rRNA (cytosine(1402)-N(4))-methyltransferase RsmH [Candidatus Gottesmanbacteria bacterium]